MNKLFEKYSRTAAGYMLAFSIVLPLIPAPVFAQTPPPAPAGGAGFAGKVSSVNPAGNSFAAEVRVVYAGASTYGGFGGVLPPGRIVTVNVPAGTILKDARGTVITLSQVTPGMLFNAAVTIDSTKVITAQTIVFGTTIGGAKPSTPPPTPLPNPSGTPPPSTTPPPAPTGGAGFAGKVIDVSWDAPNNYFNAEVRIVYAGAAKWGGFGGILPPGKIVKVNVPAGTVLKDARGTVITLSQVTPGMLFNAAVTISSTKVITAQTIVFGTTIGGAKPSTSPPTPLPNPSGTPPPVPSGTPPPAPNGGAGFAGKVSSVNPAGNSFTAEVRVVYAGSSKYGGFGGVLPPGRIVTVNVSAGTVLKDARGNIITLSQVTVGSLFNAAVTIDSTTKVITGKTVVFGVKAGTTPPGSPIPIPSGPTPSGSPSRIPSPTGAEAAVNFAGKVESVDASNNKAVVTVRLIYGGMTGGFRGGMILPGTKITVTVPPTIPITRLGVAITLADVVAGDLFNARATIDRVAHTGVASSIQVITPSLKEVIFAGTITAIAATEPKSITIKNSAGAEQPFTITATTQIFVGKTPATITDLVVGRSAALSFITVGGAKQAVKIIEATPQFQGRIDKFFSTESIQRRGEHGVQVLGASLDRFDKIIAKQETAINDLKAAGKDTTKAEALLATSKTDQAAARTSLADTRAKFDAISTSTDPKAASEAARASMRLTIDASKKVLADIRATQTEIKVLSPSPTPTMTPSPTPSTT